MTVMFRVGALCALVAVPMAASAQTVLYVNAGLATGAGNGQSWADAFHGTTALQQALDAAAPIAAGGQTVQLWTAAGSYSPTTGTTAGDPLSVTFQLFNHLEVYGGFVGTETAIAQRDIVANPTILSGHVDSVVYPSKAYHVVRLGAVDATCILDGVTISDGFAQDEFGGMGGKGGGVYNDGGSPLLRFCTITNNATETGRPTSLGGGVYTSSGSPRFEDCTFSHNVGVNGGGAAGPGDFVRCTFASNFANNGNGGASSGGTSYDHCTFTSNSCAAGSGGAISGTTSISDCVFISNTADGGGALDLGPFTVVRSTFQSNSGYNDEGVANLHSASPSSFVDCTFQGNSSGYTATMSGTAAISLVRCRFLSNDGYPNRILLLPAGSFALNCLFSANAGPIWAAPGVSFTNCSFVRGSSSAGEIRAWQSGAPVAVTNCILWDPRAGAHPQSPHLIAASGGSFALNYSDVQGLDGTLGGIGNFSADPHCNADGTLVGLSPCIDAGNSAVLPAGTTTDLLGQPRFADDPNVPNTGVGSPPVDIGAVEFQGTSCYANCDFSTSAPALNVADFTCFLQAYAAASPYANCDGSTAPPILNVQDFTCFLQKFAAGCP